MQIPVVKTLLWLVSFYTRASHLSPFKAQIGSQKSDCATCLRSNQPLQRYIDQYCHDSQTANIICSILLKNKSLTLNLQPTQFPTQSIISVKNGLFSKELPCEMMNFQFYSYEWSLEVILGNSRKHRQANELLLFMLDNLLCSVDLWKHICY